ncbi:hypothetical protein CNYM01_13459 [Colletotrichum nymphaeae SA-01]|uniref:Uncharacterized protein n=1 Tax=Colletotrichum nymphaeae SA-01 TaxID=1460502 RepID=A0A135USG3_9PEZI|nr:hypothetical protein CNYM01_13459 [Colletotrichum nymphaeae SA-01]
MELTVIAHRKVRVEATNMFRKMTFEGMPRDMAKGHEQELLALPVAFLYPWHITREHADLVHWIGFFDQTNSDSGARNRRQARPMYAGKPHKMKRSGGSSSGGNTASCRKRIVYFSVVANGFLSLSRSIATADKRTCTRSGMQLRCLTPSIGVSQQWKCQSESQIQVPGRTGERLPIEERLPLPYRSFPAIPQS